MDDNATTIKQNKSNPLHILLDLLYVDNYWLKQADHIS